MLFIKIGVAIYIILIFWSPKAAVYFSGIALVNCLIWAVYMFSFASRYHSGGVMNLSVSLTGLTIAGVLFGISLVYLKMKKTSSAK